MFKFSGARLFMNRSMVTWSIFVCFAAISLYEAGKLPFGRLGAPGAGFFPAALAALLGLVSLAGVTSALRGGADGRGSGTPLVWGKILLTVVALLGFAALFEFAGYLATTFLFVGFILRMVEGRGWLQAGAVAFCAALVSYVVFAWLLGAPLPVGFLHL
jgi:putative tricarboxylic transport membrane protein